MPDLNEVYQKYLQEKPPDYTTHMLNWISHLIRPFKLTMIKIFLEPNFMTGKTDILIEAQNLPGLTFVHGFDSRDFMDGGQDVVAEAVAQHYAEWLNSLYIPPGDTIELGEN